jgi:P4 family phage/plasmid primase-like protien
MNYLSKKDAVNESSNSGNIIFNDSFNKYFLLEDYPKFLYLIKNTKEPCFYEYIDPNKPLKLFFDIEIHKSSFSQKDFFDNSNTVIELVDNKVKEYFSDYTLNKICLSSHNNIKKSYHLIYNIIDKSEKNVYFKDYNSLKNLYKELGFDNIQDYNKKNKLYNIIDPSVYRDGLFRTIYSSKNNEKRPLIIEPEITFQHFTELDTFICYCPMENGTITTIGEILPNKVINNNIINKDLKVNNLEKKEVKIIIAFINKTYGKSRENIREIYLDENTKSIIVALRDLYCHFLEDEHQSNHQYIVIDQYSSKQKCHDEQCKDSKYKELKSDNYPIELADILKKYFKLDEELIDKAKEECKEFIRANFDNEVEVINFDRDTNTFTAPTTMRNIINFNGKCPKCNVEHQINIDGYCMVCTECSSVFPNNTLIPVGRDYNTLNNFWTQFNIVINNNTIINGEESFNCDVDLDLSILNDKTLTLLFNQALDGHKITVISEIVNFLDPNFKFCSMTWYYFDGFIWQEDIESIYMRKSIINIREYLCKIHNHYVNNKIYKKLVENVKCLQTKLHKPSFENEIISGAKIYCMDKDFFKLLNSKKHLVPFTNGVYDLLKNEFRQTKKEDYVNLTFKYDYNTNSHNPEVYQFIHNILPVKNVRDWVLKKLGECLNGDIPNTNFLMFIGDGANGKSQLLNLMKLAMGELGEKVEVTLLTRKRNNANEANTEKIKLLNKRFAFLSEPEDGEKINIGLLKELTGSEEIIARGLYQESVSFVMETKLFLACNELPEIKGEDTALWRRIRVVDFPSRFVDEPKESNEYKIDRTLPSRMREDVTWRQTFINILLEYYYKDVSEPDEVKMRTNEYRSDNSNLESWINENIKYNKNSILKLKEVVVEFTGQQKPHTSVSNKVRKEIEKWIKRNHPEEMFEMKHTTIAGENVRGWLNFSLEGQ